MTSSSTKPSKLVFFDRVIIRTKAEGIHSYDNAPREVKFLRNPHRHLFDIEISVPEYKGERTLEFFMVKKELDEYCKKVFIHNCSCELYAQSIARWLMEKYGLQECQVKVFEDGENGAQVSATAEPSRMHLAGGD